MAFVTYVSELNAQFAKEAMMCQSLDDAEEVINVRSVPLSCPIILLSNLFIFLTSE